MHSDRVQDGQAVGNLDGGGILLYPSNLMDEDVSAIKKDDAGVVWLGKGSDS